MATNTYTKQLKTNKQKAANNNQWYKEESKLIKTRSFSGNTLVAINDDAEQKGVVTGKGNKFNRKKFNYELFNNILDPVGLEHVYQPFGDLGGQLPAKFANRDITSGKIKVLLGMEMEQPFDWEVVAINEEATTRKEQKEFGMHRDFVISQIMQPLRAEIEKQQYAQLNGKQPTPEEQKQIEDSIAQELEAKTPDEVRKYMSREHQDPAEKLYSQLLNYFMTNLSLKDEFNKMFKYGIIGGTECAFVGSVGNRVRVRAVNDMDIDFDGSRMTGQIQDGSFVHHRMYMTPDEIISEFGEELEERDIRRIYDKNAVHGEDSISAEDFGYIDDRNGANTIMVSHYNWKSLNKIGFLVYQSEETGKPELDLVDENYVLNKEIGDIDISYEWIPFSYECYEIFEDLFVYCRQVPGQNKTLDNLWDSKLSYIGTSHDDTNAPPTSPLDRIVNYQILYNIIVYRVELLMSKDKGKKLVMSMSKVPKTMVSNGMAQFHYFMEANDIIYVNANEEGSQGIGDITSLVKEIDMSLASGISQYIELANYIKEQAGQAIGVTQAMEAQIGKGEAVSNSRQNIMQASHIIRPYFELHNMNKKSVLEAVLDTAVAIFSENPPAVLSNILDDMTKELIHVDMDLLLNSRPALYVANSSQALEAKQTVISLAMSAVQNQQIELGDIIRVIKSNSINEAEELIDVAAAKKQAQASQVEMQKIQSQKQALDQQAIQADKQADRDIRVNKAKEEERRETVLQQTAMQALGFAKDTDQDDDGTPDVLEVYKLGLKAKVDSMKGQLEASRHSLEMDKFEHQKEQDDIKNELEEKKIAAQKTKKASA